MSKWIKFYKNNESTFPPLIHGKSTSRYVLLRIDEGCYFVGYRVKLDGTNSFDADYTDSFDTDYPEVEIDKWKRDNITHWKPIDEPEDL